MADDRDISELQREEIQGAPPAVSGAELRERYRTETLTINKYLYQQAQQIQHMLMAANDLQALLEVLLFSMPRHFSLSAAELWLYDPESNLSHLIAGRERYAQSLQLLDEVFSIQELFQAEPDVELVQATDSRMFDLLKASHGVESALLVPLTDAGRVMGSLHLGLPDDSLQLGEAERDLLGHLALVISECLLAAMKREAISQLTVLDPMTEIGNARGFDIELSREIARAGRSQKPLTLLLAGIDDHEELYQHYGDRRGNFVVRKVAQRLSSDLRQTDSLSRLAQPLFAIILPGTGEVVGRDVAERMRRDVEDFAIDDGRGAVLQVCLSIGMVTWEPQHYPAVDMKRLAQQMETVGSNGLEAARSRGGNCIALSRLSTMMV
ncbi:MAG: diguanylate cyclase [Halioglobus sp.]|nr:diguanylate cyclase [Halioglobus sp.]